MRWKKRIIAFVAITTMVLSGILLTDTYIARQIAADGLDFRYNILLERESDIDESHDYYRVTLYFQSDGWSNPRNIRKPFLNISITARQWLDYGSPPVILNHLPICGSRPYSIDIPVAPTGIGLRVDLPLGFVICKETSLCQQEANYTRFSWSSSSWNFNELRRGIEFSVLFRVVEGSGIEARCSLDVCCVITPWEFYQVESIFAVASDHPS